MSEKGTWSELLAAPRVFVYGFLGGLFGPLLSLAGAIGLLYVATGQLPAFKEVTRNDGTRRKAITLASPLEARAAWARHSGELRGAMLELRARARSRSQD